MDPIRQFEDDSARRIEGYATDPAFQSMSRDWVEASMRRQYVYNFHSLGRPIIQYPQDMVAVQDLIWRIRPDLVIETGIAHGGSLIQSAAMLALLDMTDAIEAGTTLDPRRSSRLVLGIDIDIRAHNRSAIEAHPMSSRIRMIQGSSIDAATVDQVRAIAAGYRRILVFLDSMHTHDHVLAELEAYAPLVSPGSYCVVFDTFVENMPPGFFPDRPWDVGNSPRSAVGAFLAGHPEFSIDRAMHDRLMITAAPEGFLRHAG